MFKLLIEFRNDNKKIDDNPDLEIVTDFEKCTINALNDMFQIAAFGMFFPFITKTSALVPLQGTLMIQNFIY